MLRVGRRVSCADRREDKTVTTTAVNNTESGQGKARFFYGWMIVAVCSSLLGLSMAATQYLTGVFAVPLAESFGTTRAAVLFATASVMAIAGGIASPLVGAWLRRISLRRALLLAMAGMGTGFMLSSFATALWHLQVIYALLLAFGTSTINLGANTLVATWFIARRGRALGFAAAGISVFGFLLPPLAGHIIAGLGWRVAYQALGGLLLATLPLIALLLVDRPEQRGLRPDGAAAPIEAAGASAPRLWTVGEVLRHSLFWPIVLPTGFCLAISVTLLANLVPLAIDAGIERGRAAWLASLVALSALFGKLGFGIVADGVGQRSMVWVPALLAIGACLLLLGAGSAGYICMAASAVLLGLAFGAATPAWGALVGANFGHAGFSLAMGLMTPVVSLLLAGCVPFAAMIHDRTGSYDGALLTLAALMAAAALLARRLPK